MSAADPRQQMLSEMGECAYRLGKVFGAEAERAGTHERRLEYYQLFDRCFFAVRMSVALGLRLRRAARAEGRDGAYAEARERETAECETGERDPVERDAPETERLDAYVETEGERDREREPVSLPLFLNSLAGIAADASALPGPEPAALPSLRELLARVKSDTAPTPGPAAKPRANSALRARLAGSATTPAFAFAAAAPRLSGRASPSLAPPSLAPLGRRATGPPR